MMQTIAVTVVVLVVMAMFAWAAGLGRKKIVVHRAPTIGPDDGHYDVAEVIMDHERLDNEVNHAIEKVKEFPSKEPVADDVGDAFDPDVADAVFINPSSVQE